MSEPTTTLALPHPINFQAILDWCDERRPDIRAVIEVEKNNDSFILLLTVGFEAGRQFQLKNPTFPINQAHLYLPENQTQPIPINENSKSA